MVKKLIEIQALKNDIKNSIDSSFKKLLGNVKRLRKH